ncbi:phosphoribosylamine-glycine ligase [Mollisia scopiformis]|uniref:phosphoribosylamine--glycine ligase n=1 Tax=Mollisia scopiformis TaxID=149040 RepID=A0A194X7V9_MOLSC|nr:phosphoribosylamine-glycine ligase [Mollisia scopiformis]KUJ16250.1 phosphoribosylamine-glycine ligase [Mollisia scopiformis]
MAPFTILLVGRGGRESAFAYKLSQSKYVTKIYVGPGNGGTAQGIDKVSNLPGVSEEDFDRLVELSKKLQVNLVVPGPDVPVVNGIQSWFHNGKLLVFHASRLRKRLLSWKARKPFSKDFMARHNIPTAAYRNFTSYDTAKQYLESIDFKVVLKASGLAAGKGVIIPDTKDEGLTALKQIMCEHEFGDAGNEIVIEEFLEGDELSILTFSDGITFKSMPPAQDHKRIFDHDQGPNTGGMGCYAPTRIASAAVLEEIEKSILQPTFEGLRQEGKPFVGMLFTGIMLTKSGPKTLEYNARFGDPETQTLLPLLKSDLAEIMSACVEGRLHDTDIVMNNESCAVVIVSSEGYPGPYPKGDHIEMDGRHVQGDARFFYAGTALNEDGSLVTASGRVLGVSATAQTLEEAVAKAYEGVRTVQFNGMHYRKDIAYRAFR